jgi:sugar phosphate isomerase/epimerase
MRLSCLPVSLYADLSAGRRSIGDWFRLAADLGLDGADVSALHVAGRTMSDLEAWRRDAEDAGIAIAMLVLYSDFTHPDAGERRRQVEGVRRGIDVAARLGAQAIRLTAGQVRADVSEQEGLAWAAAGLTGSRP